MGFWSALGSAFGGGSASGLLSNLGAIDYNINPLARDSVEEYWDAASEHGLEYAARTAREMPGHVKQGLIDAGINPMLAVSSGFSGPTAQAPAQTPQAPNLNFAAQAAQIDQTNAQTDFIRKRTEGEGWQLKTLTASQARGLGMNIVKALGFHFNNNENQTFLVAYNPITGELRNVFRTDDADAVGETHDAATVRTEMEGAPGVTFYYREGEEKPYRFEYDHTKGHNLPR